MEELKKVNWPYVMAILLMGRAMYDFSLGQALASGMVLSYIAYTKWLKHNEEKHLSEKLNKLEESLKEVALVKQEVTELRTNLSGLMIKNATKPQAMKQEMEGRRFF